jgi:hypothetical protein
MTNRYTTNDLIRFLYRECSLQEQLSIKKAIEDDKELREEFENICELQKELDHNLEKPDPSSVKIILDYSRKANRNRNRPMEHSC